MGSPAATSEPNMSRSRTMATRMPMPSLDGASVAARSTTWPARPISTPADSAASTWSRMSLTSANGTSVSGVVKVTVARATVPSSLTRPCLSASAPYGDATEATDGLADTSASRDSICGCTAAIGPPSASRKTICTLPDDCAAPNSSASSRWARADSVSGSWKESL